MTDKEKIRKEVERLRNLHQMKYQQLDLDADSGLSLVECGKRNLCNELLSFIDSLQEDPLSRTPADIESAMQEVEEKSRAFTEAQQGESSDEILAQMRGEEPVSNDLEAAAKNVGQKYFPDGDNIWARPNYEAVKAECAFMDGAKWQKEQLIDKACSFLHHYQEYPNHDIATDKLVEAFKMYIEL